MAKRSSENFQTTLIEVGFPPQSTLATHPSDVLKKAFSRIGVCAFNVYIDGIGIFCRTTQHYDRNSLITQNSYHKSFFKLLSLRIMSISFSDAVLFGFPNLETKNFVIK